MATRFSLEVSRANPPAKVYPPDSPYASALVAVNALLDHDADAVRVLRAVEPHFLSITPELILRTYPRFDPAIATELCSPWQDAPPPV